MPRREANRMSIEEARHYEKLAGMGWHEWELEFNGLLKEGGWWWFQDRVIPTQEIRKKLFALGASPAVIHPFMKWLDRWLQSVGRKAGLPDRLIAKRFSPADEISRELYQLSGRGIYIYMNEEHHYYAAQDLGTGAVVGYTILGLIELKTGQATTTEKQQKWLDLAQDCPGAFGAVARPHEKPYWQKVLVG